MMKSSKWFALILGAVTLCLATTPQASFAQWDNDAANNNWDDPLNWAGDVFPAGNAVVDLDDPNHAIISSTPSFTPVDIMVGSTAGAVGRLDQTAGSASTGATNWAFIGQNGGTGTYNLADTASTGGTTTGFGPGSGTFDTNRLSVGGREFGTAGTGTLNMNTSGSLNLNDTGGAPLQVGREPGAIGVMNFDAGTVNSGYEIWYGSFGGTGTLNMSGGTLNSGAWTVFGRESGSMGMLEMTGGTINTSLTEAGSFLVMGSAGGSTGIGNVSGGTIDTTAGFGTLIGEGGNGTLNLSDTAVLSSNALFLGLNDGSVGLLDIEGSNVSISSTILGLGITGGLFTDTTGVGTINFTADTGGISVINVAGDVNLSSPDGDFLTVDLTGYTGSWVDMQLIDGLTSQGEFTGLSQGTLAAIDGNANPYTIDYSVDGDVWLRAIPEPTSLVLLSMAGLAMIGHRRR